MPAVIRTREKYGTAQPLREAAMEGAEVRAMKAMAIVCHVAISTARSRSRARRLRVA
jgi:hypothetical protein